MGDDDIIINDLLSLNLHQISEILRSQNVEVLKHLGQFSKRFDDKYKNFINESIKNVSKSLEMQSFKFVGQIWKYLFKTVTMKQSMIEKQQQEQKKEEEKQKVEEANSSKCLYETATMNLKEFLKSKKVQEYVFSINVPQPQSMRITKNEQFLNSNLDKSTLLQKQGNILDNQLQEEGFYSESTSKRSSVELNESLTFQPDVSQFSLKSQFNNSQLLQLNAKKLGSEDNDKEKICIVKQKITLQDETSAVQIKSLKKELDFANKKVQDMQQQLLDITTGYIRDVNHFKDLALGNIKLSTADFFEVKYFDSTVILDEKLRNLLNDKLDDMKRQCEKRFSEVYSKHKVASKDLEKLTKTLNQFLENNNYVHNLKTVFQQQPNDYLIWKAIQDLKGLDFLFNIIENQKPQYGIQYAEIDKFISKSSAVSRQFQVYQNILQQKYDELNKNYQMIYNEAEQSIKESKLKCQEVDKNLENSILECLQSKEEEMRRQIEQKLFEEYDEKRMQLYEDFRFDNSTIRRVETLEKKLAFQKWRFCIQILMKKQITRKKLINLLNFKNKLKKNIPDLIELDQEIVEQNDANEEKDEELTQIEKMKRYEWSYEKELERKDIRIQELSNINKVLQRKIKYLYDQLQKIQLDRYRTQKERIILDGKISLLKLAFKEICKAVKYEYNLQINETQFKNQDTDKRVKQFLKDIQNSSEDVQGLIQLQTDGTAKAISVLAEAQQGSLFSSYNFTQNQEVQTHIQQIDIPLSQLEQEFISLEKEYIDIRTANEQFTQKQLESYKRASLANRQSIFQNKESVEIGIQVDLSRQTKKSMAVTLEIGQKKRQHKDSEEKSQNSSDEDEFETEYLTTKRIQNRSLEKSGINHINNRSSLTPNQQIRSNNQNIQYPQLQMTQLEKGVFNRLWNEGNKKKVRLEKLKEEQHKRESEIWQEMVNYTSFASIQNNLQQNGNNQQSGQLNNENNERLKTDPSNIRQLQRLNNSGILNEKMLSKGNTDLSSHIYMQNNIGGMNMILDSEQMNLNRDISFRKYNTKSPMNHNKPSTPFMMAQQRNFHQTLKNSQNSSFIRADLDKSYSKQESYIRYFNEENEKQQSILQPLQIKMAQREQRSLSSISNHEKKNNEGNKLQKIHQGRPIIQEQKISQQINKKEKNERMMMIHDGSIQFLPNPENNSSKSPSMYTTQNMSQKRRKIPIKQPNPHNQQPILSLEVKNLKTDNSQLGKQP